MLRPYAPTGAMRIDDDEHQRWPEKLLISGRSETKYVTMVTKLSIPYCEAHLVKSDCKESYISDTNWLRHI